MWNPPVLFVVALLWFLLAAFFRFTIYWLESKYNNALTFLFALACAFGIIPALNYFLVKQYGLFVDNELMFTIQWAILTGFFEYLVYTSDDWVSITVEYTLEEKIDDPHFRVPEKQRLRRLSPSEVVKIRKQVKQ